MGTTISSVRVPSHDMVCLKFSFESFDGVILVTFNGRILGPFLGSSRFESESEYHHIMTIYGLGHQFNGWYTSHTLFYSKTGE